MKKMDGEEVDLELDQEFDEGLTELVMYLIENEDVREEVTARFLARGYHLMLVPVEDSGQG